MLPVASQVPLPETITAGMLALLPAKEVLTHKDTLAFATCFCRALWLRWLFLLVLGPFFISPNASRSSDGSFRDLPIVILFDMKVKRRGACVSPPTATFELLI